VARRILVYSIIALLDRGYAPYHGPMDEAEYKRLGCESKRRAQWFCDDQHRFICVGCGRKHCTLLSPAGIRPLLVAGKPRRPPFLAYAQFPAISVDQLLEAKKVLRSDEVMWCLNCSRSEVYDKVERGDLDALEVKPFRVTSESVKRELERVRG
jgi:hypothetical protein